jgi:hypothetical protein
MPENTPQSPEGIERTPTGEIANQSPPSQTTATATTTSSAPTTSEPSKDPISLLNQQGAQQAPEAYEDFKVPDGFELTEDVNKEIRSEFKGMNLSQVNAQKLVDMYVKHTREAYNQPFEAYKAMRETWVEEAKRHPEIGGNLDRVKQTIGRALDGLGDAALANEFRQAMDLTGVGDHPAFIRAFYRMAQRLTEGTPVTGRGPAPVTPPGGRPTAASALYPNLPSG